MAIMLSGLAALVWPVTTLTVLRLLFGACALADGLIILSQLARSKWEHKRELWLRGLVSIALGMFIGLWSSVMAPVLVAIIAVWVILVRTFEVGWMRVIMGKWQTVWGNLTGNKMMRAR